MMKNKKIKNFFRLRRFLRRLIGTPDSPTKLAFLAKKKALT
jgi:hypothetical protein